MSRALLPLVSLMKDCTTTNTTDRIDQSPVCTRPRCVTTRQARTQWMVADFQPPPHSSISVLNTSATRARTPEGMG